MAAPLFDRLNEYIKKNNYPFHMPGHKQGDIFSSMEFLKYDMTEIPGLDNLHRARDVIYKAESMCAKTFGADRSFFLINGSSGGIIASILSIVKENEEIIIARNCHKSVYSGVLLSGATPCYIMPEYIDQYKMAGGISPWEVEKSIKNNPKSKAIIITSPTYEGFVSDIKKIADIAHRNNMILIVDEAHGAHMAFNEYFPKTALESGADIVIQSLHKTLPSPTQTALLHTKGRSVDIEKIEFYLSVIQTTSPSYILMSYIDRCRDFLDSLGEDMFAKYVQNIKKFREELRGLRHLKVLDTRLEGTKGIEEIDLGKLVICTGDGGMTGYNLFEKLYKDYNIMVELSSYRHIIAMTSVCDTQEGFVLLKNALKDIDREIERESKIVVSGHRAYTKHLSKPTVVMNLKNAEGMKRTPIFIKDSIGKVSGEFIIPYPPGIPIIAPGELITEEILNSILEYVKIGVELLGLKDEKIERIDVIDFD